MTQAEFLRVEEGLRHVIALEFGEKDNELVDDCIQDLRLRLKDRGIKIEQGDYSNVEITFGSLIAPTPSKKQPNIYKCALKEVGEAIVNDRLDTNNK